MSNNIGVLQHLGPKKQTRKTHKIRIGFELYQIFMYTFLCQTVLIFPIYVPFAKRIEIFWFRGVSTIQVLGHFELYEAFMCYTVLIFPIYLYIIRRENLKNYVWRHGGIEDISYSKNLIKKIIKAFEPNHVFMFQNVLILPYCKILTCTKSSTQ